MAAGEFRLQRRNCNGGTVRLVMLPDEAHGYAARETIEHVLFEMVSWMERYTKDVQPK